VERKKNVIFLKIQFFGVVALFLYILFFNQYVLELTGLCFMVIRMSSAGVRFCCQGYWERFGARNFFPLQFDLFF